MTRVALLLFAVCLCCTPVSPVTADEATPVGELLLAAVPPSAMEKSAAGKIAGDDGLIVARPSDAFDASSWGHAAADDPTERYVRPFAEPADRPAYAARTRTPRSDASAPANDAPKPAAQTALPYGWLAAGGVAALLCVLLLLSRRRGRGPLPAMMIAEPAAPRPRATPERAQPQAEPARRAA